MDNNIKEELVVKLQQLLQSENVTAVRTQVEELKAKFYSLYNTEQEQFKKAAEEAAAKVGEVLENWQPKIDDLEQQFRDLLAQYKTKRAEALKASEEQMAQNLTIKQDVITQIEVLLANENADVFNSLKTIKELQARWKETGDVAPQQKRSLEEKYNQLLEQFYDLLKLNIELRDIDFKKNLEAKEALITKAEALEESTDAVEASKQLQQLHKEWSEIGPVAKDLREQIWARFKEASTFINKKHQEFFAQMHDKENANLEQKQAIIERLKAMDLTTLATARQWNEAFQQLQDLQAKWRTIGFAPKKVNVKIYKEYRALCDAFFKARSTFFKGMHSELDENLKKKNVLLAKAEELKNSTDWQATTEAFIQLQKDWKKIGGVARKYSDDLWNKFTSACDTFFEAKRVANPSDTTGAVPTEPTAINEEKTRLVRMRDRMKQELLMAENNIAQFTTKSKGANTLLEGVRKQIEQLKSKIQDTEKRIKALNKEQ